MRNNVYFLLDGVCGFFYMPGIDSDRENLQNKLCPSKSHQKNLKNSIGKHIRINMKSTT